MISTEAAARAARIRAQSARTVVSLDELRAGGVSDERIRANLAATRWSRCGRAVVLHTAPLNRRERWDAALVNAGAGSVLTSFTGLELIGLRGWERERIHVLMRDRSPRFRGTDLDVRAHFARTWPVRIDLARPQAHDRCAALVRAAAEFTSVRPAMGLLAAAVTQRLVATPDVLVALERARRSRHRRALIAACHDIGQGAQALSEIDFVQLCRRHGLPEPMLQRLRPDAQGRRRYLDASWRLPDGTIVGVEIDGAYHLDGAQQGRDNVRHNALVLVGTRLLRFPAWMVRECPEEVLEQLRVVLAPLLIATV